MWAQQGYTPTATINYTWNGYPTSFSPFALVTSIAADTMQNIFTGGYYVESVKFGATKLTCPIQTIGSFFTKYDSTGKLLWTQGSQINDPGTFQNQNMAKIYATATDQAGNSFITGYFHDSVSFGSNLLVTNAYQYGNADGDVFLVKYSPSGNVLWAESPATVSETAAGGSSVTTDSFGNSYITGPFWDTLVFGSYTLLTNYWESQVRGVSFYLAKYDSNGNVLWAKQTDPNHGTASASSAITHDANNNIYMSGIFVDTLSWGTQTIITPDPTQAIFYTKFNNNGVALTVKKIAVGDSIEVWGTSMATDAQGYSYIAAVFNDSITCGSYIYHSQYGSILIVKVSPAGGIVWVKKIDGISGWFNSLSVDSHGHLYVYGSATHNILFGADTLQITRGLEQYALLKFDTAGNAMCNSIIPNDIWGAIVADPKGNGAYAGGALYDADKFGTTTIGPGTNYGGAWPFTAKWDGCAEDDFYALGYTKGTCKGQCTGSAQATTGGGYPPFLYSWNTNPVQTTQTVAGLCPGNYVVTVTDSLGYKAKQLLTVSSQQNYLNVHATQGTICKGYTTTLTASGTLSYTWSPAAGLSCTNCPNPVADPLSGSTYYVSGIDSLGCKDTTAFTLNVLPLPTISSGGDVCPGISFTINATGGSAYNWSNGETTSNISVMPGTGTTYSVKVTVGNNACVDTLYSRILVKPTPVVTVCCNTSIIGGENVQLTATGMGTYSWSPITGLSCDTCSNPIAAPFQTTTYTVLVTNDSGCSASAAVIIDVSCHIFIPDAFSPNGDGQNDYLYVRGDCIKTMQFEIFDRWGNKVFETTDKSIPWNGVFNGQAANTGSYVYYLSATLYDGTTQTKKGNVALVR